MVLQEDVGNIIKFVSNEEVLAKMETKRRLTYRIRKRGEIVRKYNEKRRPGNSETYSTH